MTVSPTARRDAGARPVAGAPARRAAQCRDEGGPLGSEGRPVVTRRHRGLRRRGQSFRPLHILLCLSHTKS